MYSRHFCTAIDGNKVYVMERDEVKVYSYDITKDGWSQLPDCVHEKGSINIVNGLLTTVGGFRHNTFSNQLFSLTGEGRWTKNYPPMPTKRMWLSAVCTGTALIAAGGWGVSGALSVVEVMNTETHRWSAAAQNLPQPVYQASPIICGDQLFMLGGVSKERVSTKLVHTISVGALLQSYTVCASSSALGAKLESISLEDKSSNWRPLADMPFTAATCEVFCGRLLAIGGTMDSGISSTAVHM